MVEFPVLAGSLQGALAGRRPVDQQSFHVQLLVIDIQLGSMHLVVVG
jgi:hypothetical protein